MDAISLAQLTLFAGTLALAILSPGPGIIACAQAAMSRGRERAMPFALGLAFGASLWGLLALFGLSVLFRLVPQLLVLMKIAGGVYLLWVAWKMWRHAADPLPDLAAVQGGPGFLSGMALNLSNPKPALFYGAVLLSIFPGLHGFAGPALIYLVSLTCELVFYVLVTLLMSTGPMRRRYFGAKTWIDRIAAGLIGALGVTLILRH
ncbi:LysE family translocator [Paracoccus sp. S-4012]|uniref:LysE family translocator n=1 Tax=Paracoccus sp. S-4012 TaxID=2665648 RepID=UPI0012B00A2E|nr:LysE family translocator [Paracoccus sp. S-4012]MRX50346.1 LysE family translocator [Paracoccus sp. S-4012]